MEEEMEKFSDDPEENLRMENEFLKMKISAQHGGEYGAMGGLPPEIENQFLKTVLEFEGSIGNEPVLQKIAGILGHPQWRPSEQVPDADLETAIEEIDMLLARHAMVVGFLGDYPNRLKYEFLIGEMMQHETDTAFHMEGMTMNFIYEEFHPNHAYDIEYMAKRFVEGWFEKDINGFTRLLPETVVAGAGETLPKNEVVKKIGHLFDAFDSFKDEMVEYKETSYDFDEEEGQGIGYVAGNISYVGVLDNGEEMLFEGEMKLYYLFQGYGWDLMFFHMPGFNWK